MNKQQLAQKIWASANQMRSKIEASEYKDFIRSFCPCGNLVGECLPQTLLCALSGEKGGHRPCERNTIRPTAVMW